MSIADRLAELGITLPAAAAPVAAYVPALQHGDLVFSSGQVPFVDGRPAGKSLRDVLTEWRAGGQEHQRVTLLKGQHAQHHLSATLDQAEDRRLFLFERATAARSFEPSAPPGAIRPG